MRFLIAALVTLAPALASACPACAREQPPSAAPWIALGMTVPLLVAGVVAGVIVRGQRGGR